MTPEHCRGCHTLDLPCAHGVRTDDGRVCPTVEHACISQEGAALWDAVRRSGAWTGGGFSPRRIDRAAVHARLSGTSGWIVEALLDDFEPVALEALATADRKKRKSVHPSKDERGGSDDGDEA